MHYLLQNFSNIQTMLAQLLPYHYYTSVSEVNVVELTVDLFSIGVRPEKRS